MNVNDSCLVPSCKQVTSARLCRRHDAMLHKLGVVGHRCTVNGCIKPRYSYLKCNDHYKKWLRLGERLCGFDDCEKPHYGRELCRVHHGLYKITGTPQGNERLCLFGCGQGVSPFSQKWCMTHHDQWDEFSAAYRNLAAENGRLKANSCGGCGRPAERWAYLYQIDGLHQENDFGGFAMAGGCYEPRCLECFADTGQPDHLGTFGGTRKGKFLKHRCRTEGCEGKRDFAGFCTGCREQWLLEVVAT